jgi:hypothetical protein
LSRLRVIKQHRCDPRLPDQALVTMGN